MFFIPLDPFTMINLIYMAAAVVPAIVLLKYIYDSENADREPLDLLIKLLIGGAVSVIPAFFLEMFANYLIGPSNNTRMYNLISAFLGVALIEEGCKLFFLKRISFHAPSFDHRFDGILYAIFVSLGFAIIENIRYVYMGGLSTAAMRALTSIPGHMCFAIPMGYFYARAKSNALRGKSIGLNMFLAWFSAMIFHGIYDYVLMQSDTLSFVLILLVIYIILFSLAHREYRHNDL